MKRKDLAKTFMMILNKNKTLFSIVFRVVRVKQL